jgi:hypothetical protein
MKPSKAKDIVKTILERDHQARDDDKILLAEVWKEEVGVFTLMSLSAYEAIQEMVGGRLSMPETIRRARQKLQELNPDLRGKRWDERHGLEEVTIDDLKKFAS